MKKKKEKTSSGRVGAPMIMSLEYIQAQKELKKFEGLNRVQVEAKIKSMSNCDITNYMSKIGLRPNGDRRMMYMAIMKKFDECVVCFERQESIAAMPQNSFEPTASVQDNYRDFVEKFKV